MEMQESTAMQYKAKRGKEIDTTRGSSPTSDYIGIISLKLESLELLFPKYVN